MNVDEDDVVICIADDELKSLYDETEQLNSDTQSRNEERVEELDASPQNQIEAVGNVSSTQDLEKCLFDMLQSLTTRLCQNTIDLRWLLPTSKTIIRQIEDLCKIRAETTPQNFDAIKKQKAAAKSIFGNILKDTKTSLAVRNIKFITSITSKIKKISKVLFANTKPSIRIESFKDVDKPKPANRSSPPKKTCPEKLTPSTPSGKKNRSDSIRQKAEPQKSGVDRHSVRDSSLQDKRQNPKFPSLKAVPFSQMPIKAVSAYPDKFQASSDNQLRPINSSKPGNGCNKEAFAETCKNDASLKETIGQKSICVEQSTSHQANFSEIYQEALKMDVALKKAVGLKPVQAEKITSHQTNFSEIYQEALKMDAALKRTTGPKGIQAEKFTSHHSNLSDRYQDSQKMDAAVKHMSGPKPAEAGRSKDEIHNEALKMEALLNKAIHPRHVYPESSKNHQVHDKMGSHSKDSVYLTSLHGKKVPESEKMTYRSSSLPVSGTSRSTGTTDETSFKQRAYTEALKMQSYLTLAKFEPFNLNPLMRNGRSEQTKVLTEDETSSINHSVAHPKIDDRLASHHEDNFQIPAPQTVYNSRKEQEDELSVIVNPFGLESRELSSTRERSVEVNRQSTIAGKLIGPREIVLQKDPRVVNNESSKDFSRSNGRQIDASKPSKYIEDRDWDFLTEKYVTSLHRSSRSGHQQYVEEKRETGAVLHQKISQSRSRSRERQLASPTHRQRKERRSRSRSRGRYRRSRSRSREDRRRSKERNRSRTNRSADEEKYSSERMYRSRSRERYHSQRATKSRSREDRKQTCDELSGSLDKDSYEYRSKDQPLRASAASNDFWMLNETYASGGNNLTQSETSPFQSGLCKLCLKDRHDFRECSLFAEESRNRIIKDLSNTVCSHCREDSHGSEKCPRILLQNNDQTLPQKESSEARNMKSLVLGLKMQYEKIQKSVKLGQVSAEPAEAPTSQPPKSQSCSVCSSNEHDANNCPYSFCKNCLRQGHQTQSCTVQVMEEPEQVTPADTGESSESKSATRTSLSPPPPPVLTRDRGSEPVARSEASQIHYGGPLWQFYVKRLVSRDRNPELANGMIEMWSRAGHNEATLSKLVYDANTESRHRLRIILMAELVKVPSSYQPAGISFEEILDETTTFFIPVSKEEDTEDGRVQSLKPLQAYIVGKMRTMAPIYGIKNDYIINVSTMIQKAVAKAGLGLAALQGLYSDKGKASVSQIVQNKLTTDDVILPASVTPNYAATIVTDFIVDFSR